MNKKNSILSYMRKYHIIMWCQENRHWKKRGKTLLTKDCPFLQICLDPQWHKWTIQYTFKDKQNEYKMHLPLGPGIKASGAEKKDKNCSLVYLVYNKTQQKIKLCASLLIYKNVHYNL